MSSALNDFDGILCFGQVDWWYHNRTHFDLQIMREFSKKVPVLYVNSLGMKIPKPSEGKMFITRVKRKIKSFMRGLTCVRENFYVFSPVNIPGISRLYIGKYLLSLQIKIALRRAGIKKPMIWVGCPTSIDVLDDIAHSKQIYQRTDRYENYSGVDSEYISCIDKKLKASSDFTVFCSTLLFEKEHGDCKKALYIEHGVDYDYFSNAGITKNEPLDVKVIPHPRAIYVGGMDHGVFDPDFFYEVAQSMPEWNFILVGSNAFNDDWCSDLQNVYKMGRRPYEEVADYMASADVLIMTWCQNDWIEVCNPVKTKEYLAVGKGVVSTPFYELKHYSEYIKSCKKPEDFAAAIRYLGENSPHADFQRDRVREITWQVQAEKIWRESID